MAYLTYLCAMIEIPGFLWAQVSQSVRTKQMTLVLASEDKETAEDWKGAIEAQIRSGHVTFS